MLAVAEPDCVTRHCWHGTSVHWVLRSGHPCSSGSTLSVSRFWTSSRVCHHLAVQSVLTTTSFWCVPVPGRRWIRPGSSRWRRRRSVGGRYHGVHGVSRKLRRYQPGRHLIGLSHCFRYPGGPIVHDLALLGRWFECEPKSLETHRPGGTHTPGRSPGSQPHHRVDMRFGAVIGARGTNHATGNAALRPCPGGRDQERAAVGRGPTAGRCLLIVAGYCRRFDSSPDNFFSVWRNPELVNGKPSSYSSRPLVARRAGLPGRPGYGVPTLPGLVAACIACVAGVERCHRTER